MGGGTDSNTKTKTHLTQKFSFSDFGHLITVENIGKCIILTRVKRKDIKISAFLGDVQLYTTYFYWEDGWGPDSSSGALIRLAGPWYILRGPDSSCGALVKASSRL